MIFLQAREPQMASEPGEAGVEPGADSLSPGRTSPAHISAQTSGPREAAPPVHSATSLRSCAWQPKRSNTRNVTWI